MANLTRLKHKFRNDAAREERRREGVHDLRLDFTDRWGDGAIIDLTALDDRPHLAHSFALALFDFCEPDRTIKRFLSIKAYEMAIKSYFWPFLSAHESCGNPPVLRPQDITTSMLQDFIDWLRLKQLSAHTSYTQFLTIARILTHLSEAYPELIDEGFEIPTYPYQGVVESVVHRAPYSEREAFEIERAALKEIRATILRLKQGSELLAKGKDPRNEGSWSDMGDILWYIKNVLGGRYLTNQELSEAGYGKLLDACYRLSRHAKREVYSYLYPLVSDLSAPLILVSLKTGFNPQPVADLCRNCLKAIPQPGKIGIIATKYRTGLAGPKTQMRVVDGRSLLGIGGVIRTFLKLTEPCLPFIPNADRDHLWVGLQQRSAERFQHPQRFFEKEVKKFSARNGLIGDDGQPLQLRLARLRPTWMTKRYRAAGNLAAVSKDANHASTSTTRGYVNNGQTIWVHEQTIAAAASDFFNSVRRRILTQQPEDPEQIADVARLIETTAERAGSMLRGEQDTFISTCKDFYNRPGGTVSAPCDRPWACFTCKNAYWTSRTLPRLIQFLDFIIEQRSLLTAEDWRAKFGLPYEVITEYILPAFRPEIVNDARLTAEAERFIVPFTLKTI